MLFSLDISFMRWQKDKVGSGRSSAEMENVEAWSELPKIRIGNN